MELNTGIVAKPDKLTNSGLLKLVVLFTPEQADEIEKVIREGRVLSRKRMDRLLKQMSNHIN